jgi:hypothetical protein
MYLFIGSLIGIIVGSGVFMSWRQRRSGDYLERLQSADVPGRGNNEAMASALAAGAARSVGAPF